MNEYATIEEMAAQTKVTTRTVRERLKQMIPLVGTRYPETALLHDGRFYRIHCESYFHFCNHRKEMTA